MLVEISDETLRKAKAFDAQGRLDMSVEEWASFRMDALSICNNLVFDIGMQEARNDLNTIGNKEEQHGK